jgi:L-2-hydroxycarboxylate dehydrogenase (NAD+)
MGGLLAATMVGWAAGGVAAGVIADYIGRRRTLMLREGIPIPTRSVGKGIGHFFGAMRIDGFIGLDAFKTQVDEYIRVFRATKPAPGTTGPLIPGDPERQSEQARRDRGVPLIPAVIDELRDISSKTGIPFD